jgi:serine protease Do
MRPASLAVVLCAFALLGFNTTCSAAKTQGPQRTPGAQVQTASLPDFASLVTKVAPSVVHVTATHSASVERPPYIEPAPPTPLPPPDLDDDELPQGTSPKGDVHALGSGFIVSGNGYIVTNAHVVAGAKEVMVTLRDKRQLPARVVAVDPPTDVALIKVAGKGLPTVTIGNPANLKVGEWVAAIGSPFGLEYSVTKGIVSAMQRALPEENYVPFIQTDAALNPGNSGGPLFNMKGEVVGINSQIYSRTGGFMGISFAIPIDVAMDVTRQLLAVGKVTRGRLGVAVQAPSPAQVKSLNLKNGKGALVTAVEKGGPADKAGLEPGDVIVRYDGKGIERATDLPRLVASTKPGASVRVEVWHKGEMKDSTVVVDELS